MFLLYTLIRAGFTQQDDLDLFDDLFLAEDIASVQQIR
jgi:hypothetical protein